MDRSKPHLPLWLRLAASRQGTTRRRLRQAPTVEVLERRLALSFGRPSLPSPSWHGIAPERAGVASSPSHKIIRTR